MNKVTDRKFKVNYYEKDDTTWVAESMLDDLEHEICLTVEMDMKTMVITDASIRFDRFPVEHCPMIEDKACKLIGMKVDHGFVRRAMKHFMGPKGCPNILTLLNISLPGIIYYYYPHMVRTGRMTQEAWEHMIDTKLKNACLGHTMRQ